MKAIRVLVADDHPIVRKGLSSALKWDAGIEVVAEAADGREVVIMAEQLRPDVVVMDISMPGLSGLEATRLIRKKLPKVKVVILTMHPAEEYVLQAMHAGASGYLAKESGLAEIASMVRDVYCGDSFVCPSIPTEELDEYLRQVRADEEKT